MPWETDQLQGWTQQTAPSGVFISLTVLPFPAKPQASQCLSREKETLAGLGYAGAKREEGMASAATRKAFSANEAGQWCAGNGEGQRGGAGWWDPAGLLVPTQLPRAPEGSGHTSMGVDALAVDAPGHPLFHRSAQERAAWWQEHKPHSSGVQIRIFSFLSTSAVIRLQDKGC